MPLYEYYCRECGTHIERLRRTDERDAPITCPTDHAHRPKRLLSVVAPLPTTSAAERPAGARPPSGGCACGGQCGCRH